MGDFQWGEPGFLVLALLCWPAYQLMRGRGVFGGGGRAAVTYAALGVVGKAPVTWRARFAFLPGALVGLAIVCMALGLARPRTPDGTTRIQREGLAIVMVVDRSGSMQARDLVVGDVSVDRLAVVKEVFKQFVAGGGEGMEGRPDDVIGLVGFARYADGLCPLTLDHGSLVTILDDLEIVTERSEDGTALGEGLGLAVERLRKHKAKSKVAILLTDGVSNVGDVKPLAAAQLASEHGVKVYCIGAGTNGYAPVPSTDLFSGRATLVRRLVEIDEKTLEEIAEKTGGKYFRATDKERLAEIYSEIDALERTEVAELKYERYDERFLPFVMAGGVALLLGLSFNATFFRRLP